MPTPRPLALSISLASILVASHAQAQQPVETQAESLEALTVTGQAATKTETPFNETPQATSVVTRDEWEARGVRSVQRAVDYTPGVFTNQIGASNRYDYLVLRGFADGSVNNTFLDGLKVMGDSGAYSSMSVDPYFLERIEVVKGPASVLYGRASPGGLVAMTSKRPEFQRSGELRLGIGNLEQRRVAFDLTGPLDAERRVAYRLTGLASASDTQFGPVEEKRYALAPAITWDVTDTTSLTLHAYLQRDPEGGYHGGLPYEGAVETRHGRRISRNFFEGEAEHDRYEREMAMIGYELEHRFSDTWTGRHKLRYLEADVVNEQAYYAGTWANETQLNRGYLDAEEDLKAWVVDNQLQADFAIGDIDHTTLLGADYQQRTTRRNESFGGLPPLDAFAPEYGATPLGVAPFYRQDRDLEQVGAYLQNQARFGNWHAMLGGRYDRVEIRNGDYLQNIHESLDDTQFSGRAGLLYAFDNGLSPFINYTTSFSPNGVADESGDILAPTEGEQVEAGLKYQPTGSEDRYSVAFFHISQQNVATKDPNESFFSAVGEIESRGVELEALAHPTDNLRMQAGYSYIDASYRRAEDGTEGNRTNQSPKHQASVWGFYTFDQGMLGGVDAGLGIRYHADIYADEQNTRKVPDYTLVDATLGYDLGRVGLEGVSARLNATNLLDKEYVASCYDLNYCYFGAERSVSATLSYAF
ncbi:TonB-dependent siderophore receptor [Billgrantia pellis]|uniref:TonB-dependent siderophore receptor n=1 Tax=Billgrantia pellis TaxID=2606936 RepID=A0A7V7FYK8_9GAMM|nr:TonB-dependent siderophore receptor [Halomonas pellis]KAA0011444.1 TonB-dependent siderophore receptor [Halomonas pellis]